MFREALKWVYVGVALWLGAIHTATAQEATMDGAQLFLTRACAGCHGMDGRSPITGMYPKVAGQNETYLLNQMRDIKSGVRANGQSSIMTGLMAGVSDEEMQILAAWLARQ